MEIHKTLIQRRHYHRSGRHKFVMKSELMTTYEAYGFNAYRRFSKTNGTLSETNAGSTQPHHLMNGRTYAPAIARFPDGHISALSADVRRMRLRGDTPY